MELIENVILSDSESRKAKFEKMLLEYSGHVNGSQGFGSQKEKTVHSFLKNFYSENSDNEEVMAEGYICDILKNHDVIEIQSKYFYRMKEKIITLLDRGYKVMVVYPIARRKYIEWIDPETGENISTKLSPKRGDIYQFLQEAYGLRDILLHPGLSFCLTIIDVKETKLLDGYGKDKKIRATKVDRLPVSYCCEIIVDSLEDYEMFVPYELDEFDRKEYAKSVKLPMNDASTALTLLSQLGIVEHISTRNRKYIYKLKENRN